VVYAISLTTLVASVLIEACDEKIRVADNDVRKCKGSVKLGAAMSVFHMIILVRGVLRLP
jgi:hypothetical protein